ncbi:hypothetical protein IMCC3135_10145 [Granulosicoccus antarcticus IMCC3135]|uniref:Transposase n=1 Tax=Granulosicoccus antarcticus IMCC3135 TaxID=1192854 RepID=A0A2Z2NLT3_9GAMM|nr:hypothetical protein IMCC3135_10145 [Granulosicoccus antarcticus IMCC3135]
MAKRKTRRERRTFNDEYKQQVLELVRAGDQPVSQICRDLDLTASTVRRWIKADQASNGTMTQNSLSETDQQELERLRAENKRLKSERDILKKRPSSPRKLCEIRVCRGAEDPFPSHRTVQCSGGFHLWLLCPEQAREEPAAGGRRELAGPDLINLQVQQRDLRQPTYPRNTQGARTQDL